MKDDTVSANMIRMILDDDNGAYTITIRKEPCEKSKAADNLSEMENKNVRNRDVISELRYKLLSRLKEERIDRYSYLGMSIGEAKLCDRHNLTLDTAINIVKQSFDEVTRHE